MFYLFPEVPVTQRITQQLFRINRNISWKPRKPRNSLNIHISNENKMTVNARPQVSYKFNLNNTVLIVPNDSWFASNCLRGCYIVINKSRTTPWCTLYLKKYAHVYCTALVMLSPFGESYVIFTHIRRGCFTGIGEFGLYSNPKT